MITPMAMAVLAAVVAAVFVAGALVCYAIAAIP